MDSELVISVLKESVYLIAVFSFFIILALWLGRYALINVIFALYLALLLTLEFPYFEKIATGSSGQDALTKIIFFTLVTIAGIFLFRRHIPGDDYEKAFEFIGKKIVLALLATILVMVFSYQALPVTDFIEPGTPIQYLFAPESYFFGWLLLPLVILFFL
jgi:hypothetical protein